jgi:outer membrane phospholipase A
MLVRSTPEHEYLWIRATVSTGYNEQTNAVIAEPEGLTSWNRICFKLLI